MGGDGDACVSRAEYIYADLSSRPNFPLAVTRADHTLWEVTNSLNE